MPSPATMRNALEPPRRTLMDHGFMTHALLWLIGAMAAVGGLLTVAAFWSMGRANYRGD